MKKEKIKIDNNDDVINAFSLWGILLWFIVLGLIAWNVWFLLPSRPGWLVPQFVNHLQTPASAGDFGESFGFASAVFGGLSLLLVVFTIHAQNKINRKIFDQLEEVFDNTNKTLNAATNVMTQTSSIAQDSTKINKIRAYVEYINCKQYEIDKLDESENKAQKKKELEDLRGELKGLAGELAEINVIDRPLGF
jgi:hypothetical protein